MTSGLQDIVSSKGVRLHAFELAAVVGGFSERAGGVSEGALSSLNIGINVSDDPLRVYENESRILEAAGLSESLHECLVRPNQVHGDTVLVIESRDELDEVQKRAAVGADGLVVTCSDVPVMLAFADCAPVIVAASSGFAVVHSGWKGTIAHISVKAAKLLMEKTGAAASELHVFIGPYIQAPDYEVAEDLAKRFVASFGELAEPVQNHLDLGACISKDLLDLGVLPEHIDNSFPSTAQSTDRFYSYRAEDGKCGRHCAFACMS